MFKSLPKLSEVVSNDEIRPIFSHAYVTKKYIYASDAHILVRLRTIMHFDERQIGIIPDDGLYLDVWTLRHLQRPNIEYVDILDQPHNIEIRHRSGEVVYYPWKTNFDMGGSNAKYPNADDLINKAKENCTKKIDRIAFKASLANKLQRGLGDEYSIVCHFDTENDPIYVLPGSSDIRDEGREGILMPILIQI